MSDEWKVSDEARGIMRLPMPQRMIALRLASPQVRTEIALECALHLSQVFPDMRAVTDALLDAALYRDESK